MASPNLSEIIATTLRSRSGVTADNVTKNNAILNRLQKRGNIKTVDGGRSIVQELEYQENSTFIRYAGYELLNTSPSDVISAAEFDYKQAAVAVTISGLEQLQNSGSEKVIDLLETRISNAEHTMQNNLASDMYSNGTASSGKQIGGLQLLVADDPTTGTVGGINRATWTFWRNAKFQTTSDGGAAASATNIQGFMNSVYNGLVRGTDKVDLILADTNYYGFYEASLQTIQRITQANDADAGFVSLKYKGADVVLDGGVGGACPTNHMYFLNSRYVKFRPHKDRNMAPLETRNSINQDATVQFIAWAGNMTLSNAQLHGVMFQT
jgi:outer membrane protein assembly factor BamB